MKNLFFVFISFLFLVPSLYSQHKEDDFRLYLSVANAKVDEGFEKKDYESVVNLLTEIKKAYLSLAEAEQKGYPGLLQDVCYNMACGYALQNKADEAIANFRQAIDNGYINYSHAIQDDDLATLRDNEEFKKLLATIREKGDYTFILKKAGPYSKMPVFTYEKASSPELIRIREYFNLDSIAGSGTDVSKILNVMTWVHNTIRHNGGHMPQVERRSAIELYEYDKINKKGMNCRALAIFLNECYLAMGIKSRYMTCLPKNEDDPDCHVINSVYSQSLGKWIWIDPSFNAYLKDENGNLLSIPEVRRRIINDQPIYMNEDANWNNETPYTKEMYIDGYMAKNLYWFQCTVASKCNADMDREYNTFVALLPSGYSKKYIDSLTYYVYDDGYFWEE